MYDRQCQHLIDDGGEWVQCRRTDTRAYVLGSWLCPEHFPYWSIYAEKENDR